MENKATSTSPLHIITDEGQVKRLTRRFLGNHNPVLSIEKKELKAYLKGHEFYTYKNEGDTVIGINPNGSLIKGYKVRQEYFYI